MAGMSSPLWAAHLSLGVAAEELWKPVDTLTRLAMPIAQWQRDSLRGHVLHIDRFGNVVTNVPVEALTGSHGYLEVALANGNAAELLGVAVGDEVTVRRS